MKFPSERLFGEQIVRQGTYKYLSIVSGSFEIGVYTMKINNYSSLIAHLVALIISARTPLKNPDTRSKNDTSA